MSDIGPDLPPHLLAKRKRKQEEAVTNAPTTTSGAKPSDPPRSPEGPEKRRRVIGPAPPPAPLDERPSEPPDASTDDSDSSDDDDDFGPSLPPSGDAALTANQGADDSAALRPAVDVTAEEKLKRDDWMMMPPRQDDLAARMDPSKPRARGFNTGKGAKGPNASGGDNSAWHETPEQKQKRLQDEMMGISKAPAHGPPQDAAKANKSRRDEEAHRKIQAHSVRTMLAHTRSRANTRVYRKSEAPLSWSSIQSAKALRRKTTLRNERSIGKRTWARVVASRIRKRKRC